MKNYKELILSVIHFDDKDIATVSDALDNVGGTNPDWIQGGEEA
jgi:hypothetical protein